MANYEVDDSVSVSDGISESIDNQEIKFSEVDADDIGQGTKRGDQSLHIENENTISNINV